MGASSARYNIYSKIHRGLRALMGETLTRVGRADPADEAQVSDALAAVESLLELCSWHLEHENHFIHPAMELRSPGSAHKTSADHVHHLDTIAALHREIARIRGASAECRALRMEALYQQLGSFVAENFEHMLVEESYNNAVLWDCYHDDEILALERALVASIPPDKNARILAVMLPAISTPERDALLGHLRAAAPREFFEGLLALLLPRLSPPEKAHLRAAFA